MKQKKRSMGFQKALFFTVSLTLTAILIITTYSGYNSSKDAIFETKRKEAVQSVGKYANLFDGWLLSKETLVETMSKAIERNEQENREREYAEPLIKSILNTTDGLLDSYVGFSDKEMYVSLNPVPKGYDCTERDWYKEAEKKKETIYTTPYMDISTGEMVITIASPFFKDNKIAGVYACDISVNYLIELTSKIKLTNHGYPILADNENNIIVHKNKKYLPFINDAGLEERTNLKTLNCDYKDTIIQLKDSETKFSQGLDTNEKDVYYSFAKLDTNSWTIGYIIPENDFNAEMQTIIRKFLTILVIAVLIGNIFISVMIRKILTPIRTMRQLADEMAKGNLNIEFNYTGKDEIGTLYQSMEATNHTIKGYIEDINYVLNEMADGNFNVRIDKEYVGDFKPIKESLHKIIVSLNKVFYEMNEASSQVAEGADNVAQEATSLAAGVSEQSMTIKRLEEAVNTVVGKVEHNKDNASYARQLANESKDEIEISNEKMNALLNAMKEISEMSEEINKIVKTIDDIAFQTNILSLNAAVEAARSGEAGKGFAVVADEVRSLAGKSSAAASQTADLVERTVIAVKKGGGLAYETACSLSSVVDKTAKVDKYIGDISDSSNEEAVYIENISKGIDIITKVVDRNNNGAQNSAASSEELSSQSALMKERISQFQLLQQ